MACGYDILNAYVGNIGQNTFRINTQRTKNFNHYLFSMLSLFNNTPLYSNIQILSCLLSLFSNTPLYYDIQILSCLLCLHNRALNT